MRRPGDRPRPDTSALPLTQQRTHCKLAKPLRGAKSLIDRRRRLQEPEKMPRHASFVPDGVIPAVLLPFNEDLSIDERGFRSHLRDVAATQGISALTINAHSTEVASC